jgi:hypothetical protein
VSLAAGPSPRICAGTPNTVISSHGIPRRARGAGLWKAKAPAVALTAVVLLSTTIGGASARDQPSPYWQAWHAESISTVRGLPVRGRECRGRGPAIVDDGVRWYRRFRCTARTRAPWETYDTIAVHYVFRPLGPYAGPQSPHRLTQVRFIGGPGIP